MAAARRILLGPLGSLALLLGPANAAARTGTVAVPLPPIRPPEFSTPTKPEPPPVKPGLPPGLPVPPPASATQPPDPAAIADCDRLLTGGTVEAERPPPVATPLPGCGLPLPVRVSAIRLPDGGRVAIEPPVVLRCGFAESVAAWVRDDIAGLLAHQGGGLVKLAGVGGYQCRGRNGVAGAKLSEHASGNAMDLTALVFRDGSTAVITKVAQDQSAFAQVKITTCARFMTVLGPGSDGSHEDNLHLDMQVRRNGAHFCRWRLP